MAVIVAVMALLLLRLPTGFLPDEDQGFILTLITLPPAPRRSHTLAVAKQVANYYLTAEKDNVDYGLRRRGLQLLAGAGQNAGMAFVKLKDWNERPGAKNVAAAIAQRAFFGLSRVPDAQVFPHRAARGAGTGHLPAASIWKWKTAAISAMPR